MKDNSTTLIVQTDALKYAYHHESSFLYRDIHLARNQTLFVLGKSGSGKTTLLNLLAGFLLPQSGSVWIAGENLARMSQAQRDRFRGRNIGIVFQKNIFLSSVTVWQNLQWAAYAAGLPFDKEQAGRLLEQLGIQSKSSKKPHTLSQGEQQRVSIARALVNRPALLMADEPTSALDDENALEVIQLLKNACSSHEAALIVVTHDRRIVSSEDLIYYTTPFQTPSPQ